MTAANPKSAAAVAPSMVRGLLVVLVACRASAPPPIATPAARPPAPLAVAEPVPPPVPKRAPQALYPPGMPIGQLPYWREDVGIPLGRYHPFGNDVAVAFRKSDDWPPCVRQFAGALPRSLRDTVGEALAWCETTCANGPLVFHPPPHDGSYLGLAGTLTATSRDLALEVGYRGDAIDPERITLIADGVRWTSTRLDFEASAGSHVARLPLTREVARAVRRELDANEAVLRFESARGYEDVAIPEESKQQLRALIDALDALGPSS